MTSGSEPADSAVLPSPPDEIVIRFNEPVALTRAQVLGPDGEDILTSGDSKVGEDGLHLALPKMLARGTYTVSYHVVSLDGHPIAGSLVFSVRAVSESGGAVVDEVAFWRWTFVAARVALYLGLLGAAGGVAYTRLVHHGTLSGDELRQCGAILALLGGGAAIVALGLQGCLLLGGPPGMLAESATWAAGLSSAFGCAALCMLAGLGLVWMGNRLRSRAGDLLSLVGALVTLASFGLGGHVVTAGPRSWTIPPLVIHAGLAAFWVGSLVPLLRGLASSGQEAVPTVQSFSRVAMPAVPTMVLAGLVLAWIQVRAPLSLVTTEYGRVLLLKLALVGVLLALAAVNRLCLTPALARGKAGAARRLRQSIKAEVGVVVLILAATAVLGTTAPPRALLAQAAAGDHPHEVHEHMQAGQHIALTAEGFRAELTVSPGRIGHSGVTVSLRNPDGEPLDVPEVTLHLSNPEKGVAPLERPAVRTGPGNWHVPELPLAVAGTWQIEVEVLISDFERQSATAELTFR